MYAFKAYRVENQVVINGRHKYRQGEVLADLLNQDFTKLKEKYEECLRLEVPVRYPDIGVPDDYTQMVYAVQTFFNYVDDMVLRLPVYRDFLKPEDTRPDGLINLLSSYPELFEEGEGIFFNEAHSGDCTFDEDIHGEEYDEEEGFEARERRRRHGKDGAVSNTLSGIVLTSFTPNNPEETYSVLVGQLNRRIVKLCDNYLALAAELLRVPYVYSDLLDDYIHKLPSLLQPSAVAGAMEAYFADREEYDKTHRSGVYERMGEKRGTSTTHEVMVYEDENGGTAKRLWEVTEHGSIGSFLYDEFFGGLETGRLPKRCAICGKYFLLDSGYSADFCERIAPGEAEKTCRDIGARKRYDEKVKNDPIWLAYQRAYKTHYARVSKKKLTKPEFAAWSDWAIELRGKALNGEIEFEEYVRKLKR
ncbi:DUF6076 domain-containing protein [Ruminococcaceae bacterium OttesenSCG-928-D13]|nr:DUF6076 domain-containing protein [Ruminococcaceae bacterium OttesenSCG-928-D13]